MQASNNNNKEAKFWALALVVTCLAASASANLASHHKSRRLSEQPTTTETPTTSLLISHKNSTSDKLAPKFPKSSDDAVSSTTVAPINIEINTPDAAPSGQSSSGSPVGVYIKNLIQSSWKSTEGMKMTCGLNRRDMKSRQRQKRDAWDGFASDDLGLGNDFGTGGDHVASSGGGGASAGGNEAPSDADVQFSGHWDSPSLKGSCRRRLNGIEPHNYVANSHSLPGPKYLETHTGKFEAGDFPSVAQFETRHGVHCGAVIVNKNLLLTSAFCASSLKKPTAIQIGLGESAEQARAVVVQGLCLHRDYKLLTNNTTPEGTTITDWNEVVKQNDLALLITYEDMRFDSIVAGVCLEPEKAPNRTQFTGASLGFNRFGNKDHIHYGLEQLQHSNHPALENSTIHAPNLATAPLAPPVNTYTCPGCSSLWCPHHVNVYFSGWPLFYYDRDSARWHLKGIASRTKRRPGADPFKSFCTKTSPKDSGPEFIYTNFHHFGPKLMDSMAKCRNLGV